MPDRASLGRTIAIAALACALLAVALVLVAGPGTRVGTWGFRAGLEMLRYAAYGSIAGAILGLVGLVVGGARGLAAAGLVASLIALSVPLGFRYAASRVPVIHDVTTDTDDP